MKIALIIYSETGHSEAVGQRLLHLLQAHHEVEYIKLHVDSLQTRHLVNRPSLKLFDRVYFGFPVQGFRLPIPIKEYLTALDISPNTEVGVFTTEYFNYDWLGANSAHRQFWAMLAPHNPKPIDQKVGKIHWRHKQREQQISATLQAFTTI